MKLVGQFDYKYSLFVDLSLFLLDFSIFFDVVVFFIIHVYIYRENGSVYVNTFV